MTRKLAALVISTVVIFSLLPVLAAAAAPASSAALTSSATVFPSATDADSGSDVTPFTIRVNNTESVLSNPGSLVAPINAVSITFPPNLTASDASCAQIPAAWTCLALVRPGPDGLLLKGGSIMPGGNTSFTFAGAVAAPRFADANNNQFTVDVSSDNGQTYGRASGAPAFSVRVFQVGTLTMGRTRLTGGLQHTTAQYTFIDHSADGVSYNPSLTLENGAGQTATRTNFTPAGTRASSPGSAAFDITTTAPTAANGTQNVTVRANAQATGVVAETPGLNLTVERSPEVSLTRGSLQVNGAAQNVISRGESSYQVRIQGSKLYPPAVLNAANGGTFTTSLTLSAPGLTPIVLPLSSSSSTQELPRGHNAGLDLTYATPGTISFPSVSETTDLDAAFRFAGVDDNGAPFDVTVTLEDLLTIDVNIPTVTIDDIFTANRDITRVKDGDLVTIEGTIASNDDSFDIAIPGGLTLSLTNGNGYTAATSDFDISFENGNANFTAEITMPEDADSDHTTSVLGGSGLLSATAQVRDLAGNTSPTAGASLDIDNLVPLLSPRDNALGYYFVEGGQNKVRVTFDDGGGFGDVVYGGCFPIQWSVEGANVTDVQYHDNTSCVNDSDGPGTAAAPVLPAAGSGRNVNDRILIIDRALDLDSANEIPVNYDAEGVLNLGIVQDLTDAAINIAPSDAASIVDGRIPNIPVIEIFERGVRETTDTADWETARTRQGCRTAGTSGCDTLVEQTNYYTNDVVRAALTGGRFATDDIELVQVDPTKALDDDTRYTTVTLDIDYTEDRFGLPITTCTGTCERNDQFYGFRFVREVPRGNNTFDYLVGPVLEFIVSYDAVAPTVGTALAGQGDGDDVLVRFSEALWGGYDSADDWTIRQANNDPNAGGDDNSIFTRAQSVTPTANANERLIEAQPLNGFPVDGALYEFISDMFDAEALRYEDHAGNFTGDGLSPVS